MSTQNLPINMLASFVEELSINAPCLNKDEGKSVSQEVSMSTGINFKYFNKSKNIHKITMVIDITQKDFPDFKAHIKICGLYLIEQNLSKEEAQKYISTSGLQSLYGMAREIIVSSIKNTSYIPIILPLVDFSIDKLHID